MKHTAFFPFCGIGGGSLGFQQAGFNCIGGIDFNEAACRDYHLLLGKPATHGDISLMGPEDYRRIAGERRPDVVFSSPPCKSFSRCLPMKKAKSAKYKAMSELAFRGVWLALEAWPDEPPPFIILENVPGIKSKDRSNGWDSEIAKLLTAYGYAIHIETHDCGVLGGLAQSRRRVLIVARHRATVPELLYRPKPQTLRGIGEVIGSLPVPIAAKQNPATLPGGPMHRLTKLIPINWLRLALICTGKDWRALPPEVANTWGTVANPRVQRKRREGGHRVVGWQTPSCAVIGAASIHNWPGSIADPRLNCSPRGGAHGVQGWNLTSKTVIGYAKMDNGPYSIADSRSHEYTHRLIPGDPPCVKGPYFDIRSKRGTHLIIKAIDGTWHRPMTTLELAMLQGFPAMVNGEPLILDGASHKGWRQRIGNAVPPPTARAIAREMIKSLDAALSGGFFLSNNSIWVDPPPPYSSTPEQKFVSTNKTNLHIS